MAGFSFSQQGATPSTANSFIGKYGTGNAFLAGQTPAGKALAGAANMSTNAGPRYAAPPVTTPMSFGTPSTPVSKQTVTNTDGSTHVTEYHKPETGLINKPEKQPNAGVSSQQPTYAEGGHAIIPSGGLSATATQDNTQPITGNTTTPSGATVNTSTGGLINAPTPTGGITAGLATPAPATPPTYAGLLSSLVGKASGPSDQYTEAYNQAQEYNKELQESRTNEANAVAQNRLNPIPIGDQTGREAVMQNQYLAQQNALANQFQGASTLLGAANTQQQTQQSGLVSAVGAAQKQFPGYNQQVYDPLTNSFSGGSGGTLNDAVSTITQRVQSGKMSYDQAVSALSGYGQGGINALQQALGANFNVAQSNALESQQGTVGPAYQFADTALSNVEQAMQNVGSLQKTNIPGLNGISDFVSTQTGIGSEQTRALTGAVNTLRNAYAALLASAKGGTPTDYSGQALAEIPDRPTPNDVAALRKNFEVLGVARKDIYGNPGSSTTNTNSNAQPNSTQPAGWL